MRKKSRIALLFAVAALLGALQLGGKPAHAIPQFKKAFETMYVKADGANDDDKSLAALVDRANCNLCHMPANKKQRNAYGRELAKLLKKADKDDDAKIRAALEKVAGVKSDPKDDASLTFGEMIKKGRLPAGEAPAGPAQ